jgi:hypothetical protein
MVKYFIISNNLLTTFGLPSFEAFEEKISGDAEFREKLANDPKFSQMVSKSVSPEELQTIEGGSTSNTGGGGGILGGGMSLGLLKTLAKMAI